MDINSFFIGRLFNPEERFFYLAWILVVVTSIVLHELAHGWAAISRGDRTPEIRGHLTGNPLVHMGPFSIAVLLVFGIAWGAMPVDPTRLKGKYAEALVAAAGPAMNLALSLLSLVTLGLLLRFGAIEIDSNAAQLLWVSGSANLLLCVFNLFPIPPLDGSHILANFHGGYARFISDPSKQGVFLLGFAFAFMAAGRLLEPLTALASMVIVFVFSLPLGPF